MSVAHSFVLDTTSAFMADVAARAVITKRRPADPARLVVRPFRPGEPGRQGPFNGFSLKGLKMSSLVGLVGWRGMVGSVLMDRMREEKDFDLIEPLFFSTSNAGGKAPPWPRTKNAEGRTTSTP
jgi:hypothetical protein